MKRHLLFPLALLEVFLLRMLVRLASHGISARERARLKQALLYFRFKTIIGRIGKLFADQGLLADAGDILYLRYQEIGENLNASDMLPGTLQKMVALRKADFQTESAKTYPDDFTSVSGTYIQPEHITSELPKVSGNGLIKGLSACGGRIEGTVKVLESVLESGKLSEGDILVTRQTDPG